MQQGRERLVNQEAKGYIQHSLEEGEGHIKGDKALQQAVGRGTDGLIHSNNGVQRQIVAHHIGGVDHKVVQRHRQHRHQQSADHRAHQSALPGLVPLVDKTGGKGEHAAHDEVEHLAHIGGGGAVEHQKQQVFQQGHCHTVDGSEREGCQQEQAAESKPDGTQTENGIDYGDGVQPRVSGQRKSEDDYTVLILGRDTGGGGNTDTMLLASYDITNQKATVMSIPRDTMVNVPWDIKRINSVYNYYGGGEKGIKALYKEISQLVGFEPDYQVIVEWEAVGKIVDAMGGVYFDVPRDMNYEDPVQDLSIHQTKGYRLLSGDDAMQVLRYRHDNRKNGKMLGYPDGDLGRIKTQQGLLKAMIEQLMSLKNITKVNEFIKVFNENVETDLSFQNMLWFAKQAFLGNSSGAKLDTAQVNFVTMPNKNVSCWSRVYHSYQSYVTPNAQELLELVNNELSPFVEPSTMSDLDIMSVNSDGSVSSTTGHVEDSKAAAAPVISSGKKDEPAKDYDMDSNGNLIDPDTGEVIAPSETETGSDTPATEPTTPQEPETGGSDASTGGEDGSGSGETPEEPDNSGIIVVPTEPTESGGSGTQTTDPVTGEPLPPEA